MQGSSKNRSLDGLSKDFYLSILYASLNSYKMASLMKPLPAFVNNAEELKECMDSTSYPSVAISPDESTRKHKFNLWVNKEAEHYEFQTFDPKEYQNFIPSLNKAKCIPNYIIKLKKPYVSESYSQLTNIHGTAIGFHGTHSENVLSILKNGLCGHFNKRSLFGKGTYLSTDIDVAFSFAKQGKSWPLSVLGSNMICILLCQVLKSDQVKQGNEKLSGISINTNKLPHNYYIVQNNDHAMITHVLLYVTKSNRSLKKWIHQSCFLSFLHNYGFVILYGLVLFSICSISKFKKWF